MSKIYIGQTQLRLNFSTGADITGYTTTTIEVRKPGGSNTTWTATVSDISTGALYYDINTTSILDISGKYLMQPKVIYSNSKISYGETAELTVYGLFG